MTSPPKKVMAKTWKLNPAKKAAWFEPNCPQTFSHWLKFLTMNRRARKE